MEQAFPNLQGVSYSNMFATPDSRKLLDAMDRARADLSGQDDLAQTVPSFVVVGMQSVGKSAVLRRISGIPFPQDSEVCTPVAIELSMRDVEFSGEDTVRLLLEAQTAILGGKEFECHGYVKVELQSPECPEVTLIDLPGVFFFKTGQTDHLQEMVTTLIANRIAISTWRLVHDADPTRELTIYIFTKADLVPNKAELLRRIQKIATDKTVDSSPQCFVVQGSADSALDETNALSHVRVWLDDLQLDHVHVGIDALTQHLKKRMLDHTRAKVPEMRKLLERDLRKCRDELTKIGRVPMQPTTVVVRGITSMTNATKQRLESQLPSLRSKFEALAEEIHAIEMAPLGSIVKEAGVQEALDGIDLGPLKGDDKSTKETKWIKDLFVMAIEAKAIESSSRGMINAVFEGKLPILQRWATWFAHHFRGLMVAFVDDIFDYVARECISTGKRAKESSTQSLEDAMRRVGTQKMLDVLETNRRQALDTVDHIFQWNTGTDLMTTDLDTLHERSTPTKEEQAMLAAMSDESRVEWQGYLEGVFETRGFLDVQMKLVGDVLQREVLRMLRQFVETDTLKTLIANQDEMISATCESMAIASRRKRILAREASLETTVQSLVRL
ncbi:unnamed protein product [Aphanomyces euteiches]